ncbi:MAG TPA: hypothetical protein VJ398_04105 [Acidimicrobiia bacterium]|nr:hypothetical protein [Acidimicrobiia bacterium]
MTPGLVYVPVGQDRFEAQVIAEACRAAGIHVELVTGDASGVDPVLGIIQGHRLLTATRDIDRVMGILERHRGSVKKQPGRPS